ncbi:beta-lactamase family protein [Luteolibacter flavescens]|uniref:Beta-lactamase family protein n=1 Tax=Luteolibacter flavescens TaxID=1859460 RepID=A0ABT3FJ54_9BACT|nr:serine hydrolase domain-containing protein [Luteolibacter flavescens]MCW1883599.1 beta-lactamase family protein [Luteolibacter flavescens]
MNRRNCLKRLAVTLPTLALPTGWAETIERSGKEAADIGIIAKKFMTEHSVPGLSVAFAHRERLVFSAAYGLADEAKGEKLTSNHTFRIASVSKPITAVAIFALIEQGKLKLGDKVFGEGGLLAVKSLDKLPPKVSDVTVQHLLTHTAGGWGNERADPMFQHPELRHSDLIARTLQDHPLEHDPGTSYSYSNFGYCLLGRIIEEVTGKGYEEHVQQAVLDRCGIRTMRIAGNTLADRAPGEVVYHGRGGEDPYGMNVRRMDAHGGWLGRPEDLVKFLIRVDTRVEVPDILKEPSLKQMFQASAANPGYACGWAVNAAPNRWHAGSLPGTTTIAVTTASGMSWAGFTNARGPDINAALDRMMWEMAKAVPAWNA